MMKTKSTMIYKKWEIVLVPFPFTDLSTRKKRPALVVSPDKHNKGNEIVIAFITSNITAKRRLGDYIINEWAAANLPKPSLIRMRFATIDKTMVIKKIGKLSTPDINAFKQELLNFFGK